MCFIVICDSQGAVVNISSVAAIMPSSTFQPYGVAKAAQDKLTQDLAFEFAAKGVRVNSILPGDLLPYYPTCWPIALYGLTSHVCVHIIYLYYHFIDLPPRRRVAHLVNCVYSPVAI